MGSLTDFAENKLLDHLANLAYTPVTPLFVALGTADPTDTATGTWANEVTNANGYLRTQIPFANAATARTLTQSGPVTFPQCTGSSWGAISHWGIVTSGTHGAGDMLAHGAFSSTFTPVPGNTPTIPSSQIQISLIRTHYTAGTIAAVAPSTLTDSANNFPLYAVGSVIWVSGFTGAGNPTNNTSMTVVTSSVSSITISGVTLVSDPAGESVRLSLSGGFTDMTVNKWLDLMFRNQAFPKPATYVGLTTAILNDSDVTAPAGEVAGNNYARKQVNINGGASPTWKLATAGNVENLHAITFNTPSGAWGTVTSCFLIDSASGAGNVLCYDNESIVNQAPVANDTVEFAVNAFDMFLS